MFGFKTDQSRYAECLSFIGTNSFGLIEQKISKMGDSALLKDLSLKLMEVGNFDLADKAIVKVRGDELLQEIAVAQIAHREFGRATALTGRVTKEVPLKEIAIAEVKAGQYSSAVVLTRDKIREDALIASVCAELLRGGQIEDAAELAGTIRDDQCLKRVIISFLGALPLQKIVVAPERLGMVKSDRDILLDKIEELYRKISNKEVLKELVMTLIDSDLIETSRGGVGLLIEKRIGDVALGEVASKLIQKNQFDYAKTVCVHIQDKTILKNTALSFIRFGQSSKAVNAIETLIEKRAGDEVFEELALGLIEQGNFSLAQRVSEQIRDSQAVKRILIAWTEKVEQLVQNRTLEAKVAKRELDKMKVLFPKIERVPEALKEVAIQLVNKGESIKKTALRGAVTSLDEESKEEVEGFGSIVLQDYSFSRLGEDLFGMAKNLSEMIPEKKGDPDRYRKEIVLAFVKVQWITGVVLEGKKVITPDNRTEIQVAVEQMSSGNAASLQLTSYWATRRPGIFSF